MPAQYLVNFGTVQIYLDIEGKRCTPPGSRPRGQEQTVHFVQVSSDGAVLTKTWAIGLAEFTEQQRQMAKLYKKTVN